MAETYNCSRRVGTQHYCGNLTGLDPFCLLARASRNAGSIRTLETISLGIVAVAVLCQRRPMLP
jgi:hypothetical protein